MIVLIAFQIRTASDMCLKGDNQTEQPQSKLSICKIVPPAVLYPIKDYLSGNDKLVPTGQLEGKETILEDYSDNNQLIPNQVDKETNIEIIIRVAEEKGIKPKHLIALSLQESSLGKFLVGDAGCSHGYFHINICANPDAKNVIGDVEAETRWAADKLISHGYLEGFITLSFAKYNSPANPEIGMPHAKRVKARFPHAISLLEQITP